MTLLKITLCVVVVIVITCVSDTLARRRQPPSSRIRPYSPPPQWNYLIKQRTPKPIVLESLEEGLVIPTPAGAKSKDDIRYSSEAFSPGSEPEEDVNYQRFSLRKQVMKDMNKMLKSTYFTGRRALVNYFWSLRNMLSDGSGNKGPLRKRYQQRHDKNFKELRSPNFATVEEYDKSKLKSVMVKNSDSIVKQGGDTFYLDLGSLWDWFYARV